MSLKHGKEREGRGKRLTLHPFEKRINTVILAQCEVEILKVRRCSTGIAGNNLGNIRKDVSRPNKEGKGVSAFCWRREASPFDVNGQKALWRTHSQTCLNKTNKD